jgi:hypothetical protein
VGVTVPTKPHIDSKKKAMLLEKDRETELLKKEKYTEVAALKSQLGVSNILVYKIFPRFTSKELKLVSFILQCAYHFSDLTFLFIVYNSYSLLYPTSINPYP